MHVVTEWWIEDQRGNAPFEEERRARAKDLGRAQRLIREAAELSTSAMTTIMRTQEAAERDRACVPALLLVRICDDLNGLAVLCAEGLPFQAASLAAATWEKAHQVNTLSHDDERLTQWLEGSIEPTGHNPVSKSKSHVAAFERVAEVLHPGLPWEAMHREYLELCDLKHAHPHAIRVVGVKAWTPGEVEMAFGPTGGEQTTFLCERIALYALKAVLWGAMGFVLANDDLVDPAQIEALSKRFRAAFELVLEVQRNPLEPSADAE